MADSTQHKLDRVRPPRVQITYDVEIGDAIVMKELPFVVGIMADLTGKRDADLPERPEPSSHNGERRKAMGPNDRDAQLPPLRERKYVEIDRDNFNEVMRSIRPRLDFKVNKMTFGEDEAEKDERKRMLNLKPKRVEAEQIDVKLDFRSLEDFSPINVIKQVEELRKLLEARNRLSDLLTKLDGNTDLEAKLTELLNAGDDDFNQVKEGVKTATGGRA